MITRKSSGGGGGIRTHGTLTRTPVFKTGAFDRSATPPACEPRTHARLILKDEPERNTSAVTRLTRGKRVFRPHQTGYSP